VAREPLVDRWFEQKAHPLEAVMQAVRTAILEADPRIGETIKWQSPTFVYRGNLASIDPHARRHVTLLFHRGAEIPGDHPALEGGGAVARYMRFEDLAAVERTRSALVAVVKAWCELRDG